MHSRQPAEQVARRRARRDGGADDSIGQLTLIRGAWAPTSEKGGVTSSLSDPMLLPSNRARSPIVARGRNIADRLGRIVHTSEALARERSGSLIPGGPDVTPLPAYSLRTRPNH